jgi:hypothetical protein
LFIDPPVPPRVVGSVPTVIEDALTNVPKAFTKSPAFATKLIVGLAAVPSPLVTVIASDPAIVLVTPVPAPVLITIPFVEILYTVLALLAVPV